MDQPASIHAVGRGVATAVPDSAVIRVSAGHRATAVAGALAGADSAAGAIVAAARRHTEPRHIASTGITVWPAHDSNGRPAGFEARHSLSIRVADLAVAGDLLAELADAVGDRLQVDGVALEVTDVGAAQDRAREAAFADARRRAEHLATLAGVGLGDVLAVAEGAASALPGGREAMAMKVGGFEPGEHSVGAEVAVTWRTT
jgi:uncharacterized protein YggE